MRHILPSTLALTVRFNWVFHLFRMEIFLRILSCFFYYFVSLFDLLCFFFLDLHLFHSRFHFIYLLFFLVQCERFTTHPQMNISHEYAIHTRFKRCVDLISIMICLSLSVSSSPSLQIFDCLENRFALKMWNFTPIKTNKPSEKIHCENNTLAAIWIWFVFSSCRISMIEKHQFTALFRKIQRISHG